MSYQQLLESLTKRERDIARLIADGLSNHEIAQQLVLTHGTVKWYCGQIYNKLGVNSRAQAVRALQMLPSLEAPTVNNLSTEKRRLPLLLTPFIGRQREIAEIRHLLQSNRLLTLTGPGGTGKTRLALAVAEVVASKFADGVSFIDLALVRESALVPKAIARVLGVIEIANEPLLETLKRALAGQEHLLLIDNVEHIIDSAPIIPQLLVSAPRVKVLATSREVLRVSGEQEYPVPSLTLPVVDGSSAEDIQQSEAVSLFQQRAAMLRPDFRLTDDMLPAVAEICVRLDGLPLAIELAAARCKLLSPQALLTRLSSPLNTLTSGSRDAPARQQTLRSTIEWSYNLLDDGEKILFARLAVFRGGRSLEAIEVICAENLPIDALNGLASLVDKNLVQRKEAGGGEPRFFILETLHEFAWEKLNESGEAALMRRRHADYFLALAERAEPELHLAQQQHWFQLLETERENLRLALEWSLQGEIAVGLRLAGALSWSWVAYGYHTEGYQWTRQLLPFIDKAPLTYHPKFLVSTGRMALLHSDLPDARRLLEQAIEVAHKLGDKRQAAWALILKSFASMAEREQANACAEQGLALFRELDDKAGMASAFNALGEIARVNGQDHQAKRNYEQAIAIAEQTGNIRRKYVTLISMIRLIQREHDHERAIELFRQVMVLALEMKSHNDMAMAVQVLSGSLAAIGKPERAARLLGASQVALERMGAVNEPSDQAEIERDIADIRTLLGEAAFQSAWAEGAKLMPEQAFAEALRTS